MCCVFLMRGELHKQIKIWNIQNNSNTEHSLFFFFALVLIIYKHKLLSLFFPLSICNFFHNHEHFMNLIVLLFFLQALVLVWLTNIINYVLSLIFIYC